MPNNELIQAIKDAAKAVRVLEKMNPNGNEIPETLDFSVYTDCTNLTIAIRELERIATIRGAQQSLETALDRITRFYYSRE